MRVTSEVFLVEVADVGESGLQQFPFVAGEVILRFELQHFEAIEHGFRGAQVERFFAGDRVRELTEKESRVLRLQKEEVIESRIRLGIMRHGSGC